MTVQKLTLKSIQAQLVDYIASQQVEKETLIATLKSQSNLIETLSLQHELLSSRVEELSIKAVKRDGPKSERAMSKEDAYRIINGDLKDVGHKETAIELELSYGQIYSCRKGFTFKAVHHEIAKNAKAALMMPEEASMDDIEINLPTNEQIEALDLPDYDPNASREDDTILDEIINDSDLDNDDDLEADLPEFVLPTE